MLNCRAAERNMNLSISSNNSKTLTSGGGGAIIRYSRVINLLYLHFELSFSCLNFLIYRTTSSYLQVTKLYMQLYFTESSSYHDIQLSTLIDRKYKKIRACKNRYVTSAVSYLLFKLPCFIVGCIRSYLGAYFFGHILFSADFEPYFLVPSSEKGRFRRPPKPSVPEAGRFHRHRKESRSPCKINGLVRICSDQPTVFGSCIFWCRKLFSAKSTVYRLESLPKSGGYKKIRPYC